MKPLSPCSVFVILLIFFNITSSESNKLLVDFLKHFVRHQNIPTTISLLDCHPDYIVKIARATELPVLMNRKVLLEHSTRRNDVLNIVNLDCPAAKDSLSRVEPILLTHPTRWLFLTDSSNLQDHEQFLDDLPLRLDSDVIIAEKINSSSLSLKNIYRIDSGMGIIYEDYGNWSFSTGIRDVRPTRILARRRMNLHGKTLTASIVITDKNSLNHLTDYGERHIDSITKVNYVLTNHLMDIMNASKGFIYTSSWGIKNRTSGKWDGMVGDLLDDRADLGATPLFLTADRVPLIDYVSMTVPTYGAFIFRSPPLSYVANIFYLPFQDNVWLAAFALVALATIIFFFSWRISIRYRQGIPANEVPRFSDIIMNAAGAVTQQGAHMEAKIASGRISSFFLFLSMFFLYTSYTANIVALLQSTTTSISTLQDLKDSSLGFGVEDIVYNRYYFKMMTEPLRKAIYDTKIAPPGKKDKFMNKTEGIAKVREGLFAFHTEARAGYKMIEETYFEHEKCGLVEIEYLQVTYPWYAIKKYSPYRDIIKVQLFKMREHGVQSREVDKIYTRKPECSSQGKSFESVRLIDCHVIMLIIACGYGLALIIFVLEMLMKLCDYNATKVICMF